jgi:hypothetical protein
MGSNPLIRAANRQIMETTHVAFHFLVVTLKKKQMKIIFLIYFLQPGVSEIDFSTCNQQGYMCHLKWQTVCLASMSPWVQTPVHKN